VEPAIGLDDYPPSGSHLAILRWPGPDELVSWTVRGATVEPGTATFDLHILDTNAKAIGEWFWVPGILRVHNPRASVGDMRSTPLGSSELLPVLERLTQ